MSRRGRRRLVDCFLDETLPKLRALFLRTGRDPRRQPAPLVLIVDDNKDVAEILTLVLEFEGFRVSCAHDGLTGIAMARALRPDLIVLNYQMPELNGLDVLRVLRNDPDAPKSRIIFESGFPPVAERALAAGADAFLPMPFAVQELRNTAHRLLAA